MIKLSVISTEGILLHYETLESSSLKSGTKQRWLLSGLLFDVLLEVLANIIIYESEIRGLLEKRRQTLLFANDRIIYLDKGFHQNMWN